MRHSSGSRASFSIAAVIASSSRQPTTSPPSPCVIHSSIVIASPMTSGSPDAIDSIIDAGVASVDASETAMSDDAHTSGSSSGATKRNATLSSSPSSFTCASICAFKGPARAARISRACGISLCTRANAGTSTSRFVFGR